MVFLKKYRYLFIFTLVLLLTIICSIIRLREKEDPAAVSVSINSWGLCFREEGKCPDIDANADELRELDAWFVGDENSDTVYLTFDAGYENGHMESILDTLKEKEVTAAFFLVGNYLEMEPDLVKRMKAEGHVIGNHSYSHPDMSAILSQEDFSSELEQNEKLFMDITGEEMDKFYRPPQGKYSEENLNWAKAMGYRTVFWSLAYVDWYADDQPTREEAMEKLLNRIHPGAVILLHSTSSTNAAVLSELIDEYRQMGYNFGSLYDLS